MKTAVTIPDPLFDAAEKLAKQLDLSRSEFYARAVEAYTQQQAKRPGRTNKPMDDAEMTRRINEGLAKAGTDSSELDDVWKAARNRALGKEDW